jgi:hypothetical protein
MIFVTHKTYEYLFYWPLKRHIIAHGVGDQKITQITG